MIQLLRIFSLHKTQTLVTIFTVTTTTTDTVQILSKMDQTPKGSLQGTSLGVSSQKCESQRGSPNSTSSLSDLPWTRIDRPPWPYPTQEHVLPNDQPVNPDVLVLSCITGVFILHHSVECFCSVSSMECCLNAANLFTLLL